MDTVLEKRLYEIDPIFFEHAIACKQGKQDQMTNCMYFGCECNDGWFEPIKKFVKKTAILNQLAKKYNTKFVCDQLKEKFGEIRIYYSQNLIDKNKQINKDDGNIDAICSMFEEAVEDCEKECWNVCQWCGASGGTNGANLITTSGWISRICKKCAKEKAQRATKHYDQDNNQKYIPRITWFHEGYQFLNPYHVSGFKYNNNYYESVIQAFYCEKDKDHKSLYQKIINDNKYKKAYIVEIIANTVYNIHMEESDYNLVKSIVKAKYTYLFNKTIEAEFLETKDKLLSNMGNHHNNIWGYCTCDKCKDHQKKDLYAKILMEVREELYKNNVPYPGCVGWKNDKYYVFMQSDTSTDKKFDWKEMNYIQLYRYMEKEHITEEEIKIIL